MLHACPLEVSDWSHPKLTYPQATTINKRGANSEYRVSPIPYQSSPPTPPWGEEGRPICCHLYWLSGINRQGGAWVGPQEVHGSRILHLGGSWPAGPSLLKVTPSSQTTWSSGVFGLSRKPS